jgi:hypothetical protein
VARKPPTARDIERVLEEAANAMTAARSDITRWAAAGSGGQYAGRQRAEALVAEAEAKYDEALRIVRCGLRAGPRRYPPPPVPLYPGTA